MTTLGAGIVPGQDVPHSTIPRGTPRKRSDTCCICREQPVRVTISRKTGEQIKQRTCRECHAAKAKLYRQGSKKKKRVLIAAARFVKYSRKHNDIDLSPEFIELHDAVLDLTAKTAHNPRV